MKDLTMLVVTALLSGLVATLVTIWWQRHASLRNKKMQIFETLMSHRYMITAQESVLALNSIEVAFYKEKKVRDAYVAFLAATEKPLDTNPPIMDKHLKLLEEMAKALKLEDLHWDDLKHYYYPSGLAQKTHEEEMLRKVQLENAVQVAQRNEEQRNVSSEEQFGEQLALQVLPDLIRNPESLKILVGMTNKGD